MMRKILKAVQDPSVIAPAIRRRINSARLSPTLFDDYCGSIGSREQIMAELEESGILRELDERLKEFEQFQDVEVRGQKAGSGVMDHDEGIALYRLVRQMKPDLVVETGVCSGYSTALILKAMEINQRGMLYSIDYPEVLGQENGNEDFWDGKGSAVVPPDKSSGWLVPDSLRGRWELRLGKTQDLLAPLVKEVGSIDVFIHDSEHSYECMMFEYIVAWPALRVGGALVSDDIGWNTAFFDFSRNVRGRSAKVVGNMGIIFKD